TSSQCSMHQYGIHGAVWSHSSQEPTVAANTIEHEQHLLEAVCPNRQRYAPIRRRKRIQPETTSQVKVRGAEGNRTPDLCHAKAALYQLSYSPVWACARPATSVVPRGLGRGRVCRTAAVDRRAAELAAVRCGGLAPEVGFRLGLLVAFHHERNSARERREHHKLLHSEPLLGLPVVQSDATSRFHGLFKR